MDKPTYTISVSMKVPTVPYGSADAFISLNGLTGDEKPAEIEAMLAHSKISFDLMKTSLMEKVKVAKAAAMEGK